MTYKHSLFALFIILSVFSACKKKKNDVSNISAHNTSRSHNMGQNCMNCHKQGESGEGWFKVAGTIYDKTGASVQPNTTVFLYTGPNGTGSLKYAVEVDALGNFFTTESIDFGTGLYPATQGSTQTNYMSSSITSGECASCHGVSTSKIWVK